jgi:hypothetical protein
MNENHDLEKSTINGNTVDVDENGISAKEYDTR